MTFPGPAPCRHDAEFHTAVGDNWRLTGIKLRRIHDGISAMDAIMDVDRCA